VTNWPGTLSPGPGLVSHFVHADVAPTGAFGSSSALLNKVQHATRFAALSNLMSTPTDCPTREKHGYLGDGGLAGKCHRLPPATTAHGTHSL
jgi:Bacterial alpha-L-rhamnosidase 6 hairpin glycosidase domain